MICTCDQRSRLEGASPCFGCALHRHETHLISLRNRINKFIEAKASNDPFAIAIAAESVRDYAEDIDESHKLVMMAILKDAEKLLAKLRAGTADDD